MKATELFEKIRPLNEVAVVSHIRPDGDAIGSTLALGLALQGMGKRVHMWNADGAPARYAFLQGAEQITRPPAALPKGVQAVICVDTGDLKRIGAAAGELFARAALTFNIDHHETNHHYAQVNYVQGEAAACGCIIHHMLREWGLPITRAIAEALYAAISTDTGSFQYDSTTPDVLRTAAELIEAGVNVGEINRRIYQEIPLTALRVQQDVLTRMVIEEGGAISHYSITTAGKAALGLSMEDTKDLVDYIRVLAGVRVSIIFEEVEDGLIRMSLRSKDPRINVAELAASFGGGGHAMAAGIRMRGALADCREKVLTAIRAAVRTPV